MSARAWTGGAAALLLAGAAAAAARPAPDPPGTHNMMMVGENTVFLSHLPMFEGLDSAGKEWDTVHRYQVILEATLSRNGRDVMAEYAADRRAHPGERMYTFEPEQFVLPTLFAADAGARRESFTGRVFRGHLERPGKRVILPDVQVNVRRVIRGQKFDPAAPARPELTYVLFGRGSELFLAHAINRPPDFDQIVAVTVDGRAFTDEELAQGVEVDFAGRANTPAGRLKEGETARGSFRVAGAGQPVELAVRARREHYFEEGELRVPHTMNPTPEERRSRF